MKKIVIVIPLLILVVVLGSLIVHAYFTASELRVEDVTIVTLQIDSSWCTCNPYTPIIKNIDLYSLLNVVQSHRSAYRD